MKQTRKIIEDNQIKHPEFKDYYVLISEIEDNILIHPDICIESCKSLIEGVSKQIILTFDITKSPADLEKKDYNVQRLYREAIKLLESKFDYYIEITNDDSIIFEVDFIMIYSQSINMLSEIRNKRGEICHGRTVPKPVFSCSRFSKAIKNFTDTYLAYVLDFYFYLLENQVPEKLNYEELEEFNKNLDEEQPDFPIRKERYSAILYEYEYETYATRYNNYLSDKSEADTSITVEEQISVRPISGDEKEDTLRSFCKKEDLHYDKILKIVDDYITLERDILKADLLEALISEKSSSKADEIEKGLIELIKSNDWQKNN